MSLLNIYLSFELSPYWKCLSTSSQICDLHIKKYLFKNNCSNSSGNSFCTLQPSPQVLLGHSENWQNVFLHFRHFRRVGINYHHYISLLTFIIRVTNTPIWGPGILPLKRFSLPVVLKSFVIYLLLIVYKTSGKTQLLSQVSNTSGNTDI